jgi:hypothetical protein
MAIASRVLAALREFFIRCGKIMDMNRSALKNCASGHSISVDRQPLGRVARGWKLSIIRDVTKQATL